ncbi:phasin family protein [Polaromonas hydrogenivorans]|uniref:Phasin family protein n=1 Tax=Polaromonas hydrogenivorans TaxID=335476 RepID=A0AAU7LUG8_9BURK
MNNAAEQFIATNKANLQALTDLTTQAFAGVEKLVELNMAASKAALSESFTHIQTVMAIKDPKELMALQSGLLKPMADKSAAYAQHVQTIVTESGAEFTKAVEAKTAEAQKAFGDVLENLTKNAPAGSETAVAAFKDALSSGQNAFESVQTQTKKAVETAHSNFTAAATQASDAVKKATKSA